MTADIPQIAARTEGIAIRSVPRMRAEHVSVVYNGSTALQDVSLSLACNHITALVGPSGCGKTSFLMTLNRMTDLINGCTVSGAVQFAGRDVLDSQLDVVLHRRRIGMIFQKPNPFPLSIRRNLDLPLKEHGVRVRSERNRRIERALRDVGLWDEVKDRLHHSALQLSGGQQQRLCLARAIALQPDVLLLDEPCSALDPMATAVVEDLIRKLRTRYTIVLVTHNLGQARRVADDIAVFWSEGGPGYLLESGAMKAVCDQPQNAITQSYFQGLRG